MGQAPALCRPSLSESKDVTEREFEDVLVSQPSRPRVPLCAFPAVTECCAAGNGATHAVHESCNARSSTSEGAHWRRSLLEPHQNLGFRSYYRVGKKLGEGSFGNVYEGFPVPVDPITGLPLAQPEGDAAAGGPARPPAGGALVKARSAVKIFQVLGENNQASPRSKQQDVRKRQSFEAERAMLAQLEHPNIVRMYESFRETDHLYIVLEVCRGGELYSRLVQCVKESGGGGLPEPLARVLFKQMLQAVAYLHERRIVHRDIKTENFLLLGEQGTPEENVLKLCDFGTSAKLSDKEPRSMENIGTLSYTAPEVYADKGADIAADAWSLGVVLYVLLTGTNPFRLPGKTSKEDVVKRIRAADFEVRRRSWVRVSSAAQDIVKRFLVLDEPKRLTCMQALTFRWVTASDRPALNRSLSGFDNLAEHIPKMVTLLLRLPRLGAAQRLALMACAVTTSEADLDPTVPWRELFTAFDVDNDGSISFDELVEGLRYCVGDGQGRGARSTHKPMDRPAELPEDQLEMCMRALDLDQSGSVEWAEWLAIALLSSPKAMEASEPLSTAFRLLNRPLIASDLTEMPGGATDQTTVADLLRQWTPQSSALGKLSPRKGRAAEKPHSKAFMLSDLRRVLTYLEVYEML